eukprot:219418_1
MADDDDDANSDINDNEDTLIAMDDDQATIIYAPTVSPKSVKIITPSPTPENRTNKETSSAQPKNTTSTLYRMTSAQQRWKNIQNDIIKTKNKFINKFKRKNKNNHNHLSVDYNHKTNKLNKKTKDFMRSATEKNNNKYNGNDNQIQSDLNANIEDEHEPPLSLLRLKRIHSDPVRLNESNIYNKQKLNKTKKKSHKTV